jgi:hypothetical protein
LRAHADPDTYSNSYTNSDPHDHTQREPNSNTNSYRHSFTYTISNR